MKTILLTIMGVQIALFLIGVLELYQGKIMFGLINVVLNFGLFIININSLRMINRTNKFKS